MPAKKGVVKKKKAASSQKPRVENTLVKRFEKKISNLKKEASKIKGDLPDSFEDKIEKVEEEVENLKNLGKLSRETAKRLKDRLDDLDD